jgi:ChrR Cupin-like domain
MRFDRDEFGWPWKVKGQIVMNIARLAGTDVNPDLLQHVMLNSDSMEWQATKVAGLAEKVFERIGRGPAARETVLIRADPQVSLPGGTAECRIDILVLEGAVEAAGVRHGVGAFLRVPVGTEIHLHSPEGATLLVKKRSGVTDGRAFALDTTDRANWAAWGGRGSEKAQLYDSGDLNEASWVGFMLPNLTIPEHDHAGGEEIFILDGELRDECGLYGPGSWIRFPLGFRHSPTSLAAGCQMLVREGDTYPL